MRELIDTLRERVAGFKEAAKRCSVTEERLALGIRADEAEHCVRALERVAACGTPATNGGVH